MLLLRWLLSNYNIEHSLINIQRSSMIMALIFLQALNQNLDCLMGSSVAFIINNTIT